MAGGIEPRSIGVANRPGTVPASLPPTSAPPMGFEPTTFPVTGERPLLAGPRGRISCRGGSRTHFDRLIRTAPRRLASPQFTHTSSCQGSTSTPCGSRTRPLRLERPPTSPEVQRGIFREHCTEKANRPGVFGDPRPARVSRLAQRVTHRYPYNPDLTRLPSSLRRRPQDADSSRRSRQGRRPYDEVQCSGARGSW